MKLFWGYWIVWAGIGSAWAAPLPQPLTLRQAWEIASATPPPQITRMLARHARAEAEWTRDQARTDWEVGVNGRLRWVDANPVAEVDDNSDHMIALVARKTLYDFGRNRARALAAEKNHAGVGQQTEYTRRAHALAVMQGFFAVLLADMRYRVADEAMAVAYIRADRLRERRKLGQSADLALAEMERDYQRQLAERTRLSGEQRATRARLALLLNRPTELPDQLQAPHFPERAPGELEPLVERAMTDNLEIRALQTQLQAAKAGIEAARAHYRPELSGAVEVLGWERDFAARDRFRAGLEFNMPLYTGRRGQAEVAEAEAVYQATLADLRAKQFEVRQEVTTLWLGLQALDARHRADEAANEASDLRLDYQTTLYDLEYKADLGNSLAEQSAARLAARETEYALAEHWARLDLLTGRPLVPTPTENNP